jgi:hypothetical protein
MKTNISQNKIGKRERGAIIVEATISLTAFMFVMFTLLSVIQIAYTQARITVALDSAAKEIAEYSHIYYATGLDDSLTKTSGKSSEIAGYLSDFLEDVGGSDAASALKGDNVIDELKKGIGSALIEALMQKNLSTSLGGSADDFLKRNHVVRISYNADDFLNKKGESSASKNIFIRVSYDIQVIKLLNIDYTYHLSSCAYTQAWSGE